MNMACDGVNQINLGWKFHNFHQGAFKEAPSLVPVCSVNGQTRPGLFLKPGIIHTGEGGSYFKFPGPRSFGVFKINTSNLS